MKDIDPLGLDGEGEQKESIVKSNKALKINHIPSEIKYREDKIQQIVDNTIRPAFNGKEGQGNMVTGQAGTGKTVAVKHIVKETRENYDTSRMKIIYVNCNNNSSEKEVYRSILEQCGLEYTRGETIAFNKRKLLENFKEEEDPDLVIILDEADELYVKRRDYLSDILYTFSRPSEVDDSMDWHGNITVTCVSNDEDINKNIRDDVRDSSYSPKSTEFLPYTVGEIADILDERQKEAFVEEVLGYEECQKIAEDVKHRFESDIRMGIMVLREVANILDSQDNYSEDNVVDVAMERVKESRIEKVLNGKDKHFLLIVSSLVVNYKNDKSKLSYIVDGYRKACVEAGISRNGAESYDADESKERSKSVVWRKLEELVREDIVDKKKRYDKERNPYHYTPNVDVDLLLSLVQERLSRKGITKDIKESAVNGSEMIEDEESREEAQNEAKEVLEKHL